MDDNDYTLEQAVALLPEREYVHTFRCGRGMLFGCDMRRDHVIDAMQKSSRIAKAGPVMSGMGHGMAIDMDGDLFIETTTPEPPHA
jgi:hypothetical protein